MEPIAAGLATGLVTATFMACLFLWAAMKLGEQWRDVLRELFRFQEEAVQHGAAEWAVDDDGNRVFRWKGEAE